MSFNELTRIEIDIKWDVYLTNNDLPTFARSACALGSLSINKPWGRNTNSCGITPDGLLQLLKTCPGLWSIDLVMDTHDHTESAPEELLRLGARG